MKKIIIITGIVLGSFIGSNLPAQVFVKVRPVVPVVVVKPACPSPAHVWVDGSWSWNKRQHQYVWVNGFWVVPKPGKIWVDGQWVEGPQGHKWVNGRWVKVKVNAPHPHPHHGHRR